MLPTRLTVLGAAKRIYVLETVCAWVVIFYDLNVMNNFTHFFFLFSLYMMQFIHQLEHTEKKTAYNNNNNFNKQGRCNREKPPCKYFHPPQHLKDQLLINGRNHLALKNALMQQMGMAPNGQPIITSHLQPMVSNFVLALAPLALPTPNPIPHFLPPQEQKSP